MPTNNPYPPLTLLVPVDKIPDGINQILRLDTIFGSIYYKDYNVEKSAEGDAAQHNLTLVSYEKLALEIPGTGGLALILNPGLEPDGVVTSVFPITFDYQLEIIKYIKGLNPRNFSGNPIGYFNTLLSISDMSMTDLLESVIRTGQTHVYFIALIHTWAVLTLMLIFHFRATNFLSALPVQFN